MYVESEDVFLFVAKGGIWTFTPIGASAPPRGATNFETRCSDPAVVFCDPLDTEGPYGITGQVMLNPDGSEGLPSGTWWREWRGRQPLAANGVGAELDQAVKASGTGSLRFTYGQGGASHAGDFTTNLSDDLSVGFGEGETFYVQFRYRVECDLLYLDCDPESPDYQTTRRVPKRADGRNTRFKIAILGTGDVPDKSPANSCTDLEIVLDHGEDHYLSGYHACGWFNYFQGVAPGGQIFGSPQFSFQPGGDFDCLYFPDPTVNQRKHWGYTGPSCWKLEPDEWLTFQIGVTIGPRQEKNAGS